MSPNYCKCHQAEIGAGISCSASHSKRKCQWMAMSKTLWIFNGKYSLCSINLSIQYKYLVPVSTLVDVAFTLNTLKHQGFKLAGWHPVFDTIFQHEGITIRILSYLSYLHTCGSMLMPSHVSQTATFPTTLPSAMDSMSKWNQYNQCIQISGKHIQCTHLEKH